MKTAAFLTLALFVIGAVATPAMAHGDDDHSSDRMDARDDHMGSGDNSTSGRMDRDEDREMDREERHNRTLDRLHERCDDYENRTGRNVSACDRLEEIHDGAHQARRAAHAGDQALVAWQHLNATLARLEQKFQDKLASGNLTDNETIAFQAKLDLIHMMQERLAEKIADMEERLAGLESRWVEARAHVEERRAYRGDDDDEDEEDDHEEADHEEDDVEEESDDSGDDSGDDDSADGNETADA